MTSRNELVEQLQNEVEKVGLANNAERIYKTLLLNTLRKMVLSGKSSYDLHIWMSKQSNTCGKDLLPIVQEVYELVKGVKL